MELHRLIGNEALKARLSAQARRRGLSHAYLITGPAGCGKGVLAELLAAALLCTGQEPPCMACPDCRKVLEGIHPDVKWVDAPTVGEVRALRKDSYIRPNEGKRKLIVIQDAEQMNPPAQNALLKILEEGPDYGAFLLLAEDESSILQTVRSRCETLRLQPVPEQAAAAFLARRFPQAPLETVQAAAHACGGILGRGIAQLEEDSPARMRAAQLADCLMQRNPLALLEFSVSLEKLPREDWAAFLAETETLLHGRLLEVARGAPEALTSRELMAILALLRQLQQWGRANVGQGHLSGLLAAQCAQVLEREENSD